MWDCLECGTKNIGGLPACPHCHAPRPQEEPPAAQASDSGPVGDSADQATESGPQVTKGAKSSAKD